jgi:hypothetical protein
MISNLFRYLSLPLLLRAVVAFQPLFVGQNNVRIVQVASNTALRQSTSDTRNAVVATQQSKHTIEVVRGGEDDPRVLDVASFRNNLKNPELMVARAKEKRDAVDTTAAAVDGLKIGLLYVGPIIGGFTFMETQQVQEALQNYAVLGGGLGVLLAVNNYMGRGIHVPDIPEATK